MAKKFKHTGKIRHDDMVMLHGSRGIGGKDPHAHPSHHQFNKAHGMPEGLSPKGQDMSGGEKCGGEGMADNEEYCD